MKNWYFCLVVFISSFVLSATCAAKDVAHFDIILWGNKIGNLTATKEPRADGTVLYLLDSWSKAKVLWIVRENVLHYEVMYKDGKLISSTFKEVENGKTTRWNNVTFDGKQYHSDGTNGKKDFIESPTYSVVSVYFQSMEKVKRIFYEIEGDFNNLLTTGPGTYEFKSSDGNRNVYHYVNGVVQSMEFHLSFATIKMARVN